MNTNRSTLKKALLIVIAAISVLIGCMSASAAGTRIGTFSYQGRKYYFNIPADVQMTAGTSKKISVMTWQKDLPFVFTCTWKSSHARQFPVTETGTSKMHKTSAAATIKAGAPAKGTVVATLRFYRKDNTSRKIGAISMYCNVTVKEKKSSGQKKSIPLKSVALSKTALTLTEGESAALTVSLNPANTTENKSAVWSSSNTAAAVVSSGKVTAKKAGTAVITVKVGSKSAACKVTVKAKAPAENGRYLDVTQAYTELNRFRTTPGVWLWKTDNKTKRVFNSGSSTKLQPLKRSAQLEAAAKVRAKELMQVYAHTRPDGTKCFTAFPRLMAMGENISKDRGLTAVVVTNRWKEENEPYNGQGHRRNMLSENFNAVGIACWCENGVTCWVQCFGLE